MICFCVLYAPQPMLSELAERFMVSKPEAGLNEVYPGASTGLVGQRYLGYSIGIVSALHGWLAS